MKNALGHVYKRRVKMPLAILGSAVAMTSLVGPAVFPTSAVALAPLCDVYNTLYNSARAEGNRTAELFWLDQWAKCSRAAGEEIGGPN